MTNYDLEYKGVKCTAVEWNYENGNVFYFEYLDRPYKFLQTENVSSSADTDHIRIVIEKQFLPFVKEILTAEQMQKYTAKNILQSIHRYVLTAVSLNEYAKGFILGFVDLLAAKYDVEVNND